MKVAFSNYPYNKDRKLAHVTLKAADWKTVVIAGKVGLAWAVVRAVNNIPTMQCGKCKGWGHTKKNCHNGQTPREDDCYNCKKGGHPRRSVRCPVYRNHLKTVLTKTDYPDGAGGLLHQEGAV